MIPVWFIGGPRTGNSDVEGGNTSAKSGDAYGGDANGGKANANGGDASNNAFVWGQNSSQNGGGSDVEQQNNPDVTQGDNSADGGTADANGGDGGGANSGNTQKYDGNAFSKEEQLLRG